MMLRIRCTKCNGLVNGVSACHAIISEGKYVDNIL